MKGRIQVAEIKIYAKPSSLYRYRPLGIKADREFAALSSRHIYCPAFEDLNDPMEGLHRISSSFANNPNSEKSQVRVESTMQRMGIASFSEVHDHEPMWAHYADDFKGMCVQYSLNKLLKGLDRNTAITRMMYSESEPVLLNDSSMAVDRARLCLSSKTLRWSSEREWRVFQSEKGVATYGDDRVATRIYLGSRVCEQDELAAIAVGRELGIPVSKMAVSAYSISFNLIRSKIIRARIIKKK